MLRETVQGSSYTRALELKASLPLLCSQLCTRFSRPQAVARSVLHEHGRDVQRARRLIAGDGASINTLDFHFCARL